MNMWFHVLNMKYLGLAATLPREKHLYLFFPIGKWALYLPPRAVCKEEVNYCKWPKNVWINRVVEGQVFITFKLHTYSHCVCLFFFFFKLNCQKDSLFPIWPTLPWRDLTLQLYRWEFDTHGKVIPFLVGWLVGFVPGIYWPSVRTRNLRDLS